MIGELIPTGVTFGTGRKSINDSFSGSALFNSIALDSGGDFSGGTGGGVIYSGGTDLYNIFLTAAAGADITRIQPGTNTATGGTANFPTVNLDANIVLTSVNATTLSGGTLFSGSTDLSDLFLTQSDALFSASTGANSIIANNGTGNIASSAHGVTFGFKNFSSVAYSFIAGGYYNSAITGSNSAIVGGQSNYVKNTDAVIMGGVSNTASGKQSSVVGGNNNTSSGYYSIIAAGKSNTNASIYGFIGGGTVNTVSGGNSSSIVGGLSNTSTGSQSIIAGGQNNNSNQTNSAVLGGRANMASAAQSAVVGGIFNTASTINSGVFVSSGSTVTGLRSAVIGGQSLANSVSDSVMVPNLIVDGDFSGGTGGSVIYSAGTDINTLFFDNRRKSYISINRG